MPLPLGADSTLPITLIIRISEAPFPSTQATKIITKIDVYQNRTTSMVFRNFFSKYKEVYKEPFYENHYTEQLKTLSVTHLKVKMVVP